MWFSRKIQPPEEGLTALKIRMTKLEGEMLDLTLTIDTLRNKVLRKIQIKHERDEEEEDKTKKDLYNGVLLPIK
jgi:hypothetical protein